MEEHIRKLCVKFNISTVGADGKPLKASFLNDELKKKGAYNNLDHKSINAWQDLRNQAAHGDFTKFDKGHVEHMLMGVRGFLGRYPA